MANSQAHAVKSLNTSSGGRRRFVFKSFSQRVEGININVFRSLDAVKAQPSSESSFFRDSLVQWRELNTAEHFISFYEEMMPIVQTLPQIILHSERIFSELLARLNMDARLSLEPILVLIGDLARDILDQFVPLLQRLVVSLVDLLKSGGDHDPEILEQVFTSWSYIVMHLRKYLTRDISYVLEVTLPLRFYSKDYIQEFMAEAISFLLRNAPIDQLNKGIKKALLEVAESYAVSESSSYVRRDGVVALLWHTMRGSTLRLHSRAETVFCRLIDDSNFAISDSYPRGSEAITEVISGVIDRLCNEINPKELKVIYKCFFREVSDSINDGSLEHLKHLLGLVTFTVSKGGRVFDRQTILELVGLLTESYMKPADGGRSEDLASEVLNSIIQLMLSLLDLPLFSADLSSIMLIYGPTFKLRKSSMLTFIRGLVDKDSHILNSFQTHILSAMDDMIEDSPEEVLFLMYKCFEKQKNVSDVPIGVKQVEVLKIYKYFKETILRWITLLSDIARNHDQSDKKTSVAEVSILWGVLSCYPHFQVSQDDLSLVENFIKALDQLLVIEADEYLTLPKSTWQYLLGAALDSYCKILQNRKFGSSKSMNFMILAKKHKSSPHVLSAVADFLDYVLGVGSVNEAYLDENAVQELSHNVADTILMFADNLKLPNKMIRISTLRILSHCRPLEDQLQSNERPQKRLRTEESGSSNAGSQDINVIELLLLIETTPLSISTSRKFVIAVSKLQMGLSSGKINDDYIPLLLSGVIGILHNRFGHIWEPAVECLATLIGRYKDLTWSRFVEYLADSQSKFLSFNTDVHKINAECLQSSDLVDCFNSSLTSEDDSTPCATILTLLLQLLQKIPDIAESRSRQLMPLFLKFMGYDCDDVVSIESYNEHSCKGKEWKDVLKEWLSLLRLMHNARSLYRSQILKEVLIKRLLDEIDPDLQSKVLDCLLNWKDDYLMPYNQHLRNLIVSKNLREELASWSISRESQNIQEGHRCHLIPIVIHLLTPKVRKLKTLGSRKHTGVSHRRAVLCYLSQLEVEELQLFFSLLVKPLIPKSFRVEVFDLRNVGISEEFRDQSQASVLVKCSTTMTVSNLSWKKINGFLHVVEDIFGTFDEFHLNPFLSPLLMIVVRILERCMSDLASASENSVNVGKFGDDAADPPSETNHMAVDSVVVGDADTHTKLSNSGVWKEDVKAKAIENNQSKQNVFSSFKRIKDMRSLCLKIVSFALKKYESDHFGSDFWNIFFPSIKPLIDSFKQEGSSSEKPSSLFSCFLAMSHSFKLVKLLEWEPDLVPNIFSMLTVRTASNAILSYVLDFIENLLNLDSDLDDEEGNTLKVLLLPHLEVLIHSFHVLLQSHKEYYRKSSIWPEKKELRIFKLLGKYINNSVVAGQFLDILLPLFKKKDSNSDECLEALHVVKSILPILTAETSGRIINGIYPLLVSAGLELRLCICDILDGIKLIDPSLEFLATLLRELNAVSSSEIGEPDYDVRVNAYHKIRPELFSELREEHALVIISQCVHDMSSEELIFRQSASRALLSFVDFAGSVLNRHRKDFPTMSLDDLAQKGIKDLIPEQNDTVATWTSACIGQIVKKTFMHHIGEAMNKDTSIQKEWIAVLRELVCNLQEIPYLTSFRALCSEDPEVDFFNNILHLQIHRRRRALSRFRNVICLGNLSEDVMVKIFLPMFYNMLFDVKDGKGEDLRNACLETLGSISKYMPWESYRSFLMKCFREMVLKQERQKILLRLICIIIDMFHFFDISEVREEGGVEAITSGHYARDSSIVFSTSSTGLNVPVEIQVYIQKAVLPKIQKLLKSDSEKVNVNINLAVLKVLKLIPGDTMESHLSSIIHRICGFLKHHFQSVRDEARSSLAACVKELGLEYLHFVVKVLQAILKRGYELHVLGYTLNFILAKTLVHSTVGKLDYCLEDLLSVVENDILGDVAEEKEVDKIASKMKETRKNKSFETLKLISQCVSFGTHAMKLLLPINSQLQKHMTPKIKVKLEMMLHNIALGIESNPSASSSELFIFVYGLIEDTVAAEDSHAKETTLPGSEKKPVNETTQKKYASGPISRGLQNSHLISVFALGLLHNRLKKIKLDKRDELLLSMLDPFVKLLGDCLNSKYEDVLSAAFRCLILLVKLPLPSLESQADKIKILLLDIARKSGNADGLSVQSCLKLLTVLLRSTRITLSDDQLHLLIQFPLFVDIQTKPSPIALSLLKSIIARKLVVHEIYDIVMQVAELMVTSQSEPIRNKCSQILLQFLLDYRLSNKRLQQHMDFLLTNLSYEHSSGREAVLEMLHVVLVKFPKSVIDSQAQTFFLHLVVALANDHDSKIRAMVATVIKVLIGRTSHHQLYRILEFSLSWYTSDKRHLWSASAQVLGLLVEVFKGGFQDHITNVLQVVRRILECSVHASREVKICNEPELPLWKEAYYSIVMLEKILLQFPELYFNRDQEEIWLLICRLLLHQHIWVRNACSQLVGSYFTAVSEASKSDVAKMYHENLYLLYPGRLFFIAVSLLNQLKTPLIDDAASNLLTQNLAFTVCRLHYFAKQAKSFNMYWSSLDSSEQDSYLEAFELLGSQKAKSAFLLYTNSTSQFSEEKDQIDQNRASGLHLVLIIPILKSMGKIALQMEDIQMKVVLNCFKMISVQTAIDGCNSYAIHMLLPLYKVSEGFAGKVITDASKQLAEEVRDHIRNLLGVETFIQVYNSIRRNMKEKRDKRKHEQKLTAVINPMRHAKQKLRIAVKHRAHKKRKIMSMKMGRWRR